MSVPDVTRVTTLLDELSVMMQDIHFGPAFEMIPKGTYSIEQATSEKMQNQLKTYERRQRLIPLLAAMAKKMAVVSQSQLSRGIAALGKSGRIYFAHNMQFPGSLPSSSISAVQFLLVLARHYKEQGFTAIAFSDELTGTDRDFMRELSLTSKCTIHVGEKQEEAAQFVSKYDGLLIKESLFEQKEVQSEEEFQGLAQCAANLSHAPLTQARCGVAIKMQDGTHFTGHYIETPYDTQLMPLQSALILMLAKGYKCNDIKRVMVALPHNQTFPFTNSVEHVLRNIAQHVQLEVTYY